MFIRTEATPTASTLKVLPGQPVIGEGTTDFPTRAAVVRSPLAQTRTTSLARVVRAQWRERTSATRKQSAKATLSAENADGHKASGRARDAPRVLCHTVVARCVAAFGGPL